MLTARRTVFTAALGLTLLFGGADLHAHCQVPCGIYDDAARIDQLREDVKTIRKAVTKIGELTGKKDAQSMNQLSRWVANKEKHAANIIEVMAEYFFAQRIKAVTASNDGHVEYLEKLGDHHAVIVAAMKTKQKADSGAVDELSAALDVLASYYPHED